MLVATQYVFNWFSRNVYQLGKLVDSALQVLLGGGNLGDGKGRFSDKVIKIPSRRGPDALCFILNDFEANGLSFLDYYDAKAKSIL
jgi:sulfite reductase (ferredoxin)